jgi:NACHT domain/Effector-associated domain 10
MTIPEPLHSILERITQHQQTVEDLEVLRRSLHQDGRLLQWVSQDGKFNVNIGEIVGGQLHIGDHTTLSDEQIQAIAQAIREQLAPSVTEELPAIDDLVQQVRSRIHDDIQRLHGTMPLWGVDHWVPLGELFVDVNILEEVSSNRRSELADLWQDFSQNPGYRGLERMGLGKERQRVSGLEVLDRNTNLMVVGKPGSGKTTYLQRVVTECNVGNLQAHRIPVLIRLREFVEDGRSVDYAVEGYLERCWRLSAVEVQLVLDAGRLLVLLDGLDEVTGTDGQAIAKQIKRFARDYPQVQVIVTCRTQSQESRFERFDSVEVADFNEPQVRAFAEHWFQTVCGDFIVGQTKAVAFLDQLFREENKPIRELAITPILLSLTCAVFQQTGKFYSKRPKLYEEGLELLLEQWDKSREIERDEIYRDLSVERKLELLSYLAVKKFEQEQYVLFEQAEIEGYIGEFLRIGVRESRGVLRAIEAQHGLLVERSYKIWSFSHLIFQEYLVAKYSCQAANLEYLFIFLLQKKWREIFIFSAYIASPSNIFFAKFLSEIHAISVKISKDHKLNKILRLIYEKSLSKKSKSYLRTRIFYLLEVITTNKNTGCEDGTLWIPPLLLMILIALIAMLTINIKTLFGKIFGSWIKFIEIKVKIFTSVIPINVFQEIYNSLYDFIIFSFGMFSFSNRDGRDILEPVNYDYELRRLDENRSLNSLIYIQSELISVFDKLLHINPSLNSGDQVQYFDAKFENFCVKCSQISYQSPDLAEFFKEILTILKKTPPSGEYHITWYLVFYSDIDTWYVAKRQAVKKMRMFMTRKYNVCHDWKLNIKQKKSLYRYYYVIQLLMECSSNTQFVDRKIRERISDEILIPIAEIEKRNRKKAEVE